MQQFENVVAKTYASPVLKFGDFNFMSEVIGNFEGDLDNNETMPDHMPEHRPDHMPDHRPEHRPNHRPNHKHDH